MVYNQRFVISVLVNGKVQKEFNDGTVELPFGSEYVIRLRNKHKDRRAVCKLYVDGEERSNDGYVIPPRSYVDIRNDSYHQSFKLVASDSVEAQDEGKDKDNTERNNGVIEGRFYLETEPPVQEHHHHHHHHPITTPWPRPWHRPFPDYRYYGSSSAGYSSGKITCKSKGGPSGQSVSSGADYETKTCSMPPTASADAGSETLSLNEAAPAMPILDPESFAPPIAKSGVRRVRKRETEAGVTVDAGFKGQTYRAVSIDLEDEFVLVKLLLRGFAGNVMEAVAEEVASGTKRSGHYCPNCGKKAKKKANFCGQCGHQF